MLSAVQARQDAGLSLQQAAKLARVCPAYLRRVEKHGDAPYVLAMRLARLYSCSANIFLFVPQEGPSRRLQSLSAGRKPTNSTSQKPRKMKQATTKSAPGTATTARLRSTQVAEKGGGKPILQHR